MLADNIEMLERFVDRLDRSRWNRIKFSSCPVCGNKTFIMRGNPRYQNYRYQMSRIQQTMQCRECFTILTGSRYQGAGKWVFDRE